MDLFILGARNGQQFACTKRPFCIRNDHFVYETTILNTKQMVFRMTCVPNE